MIALSLAAAVAQVKPGTPWLDLNSGELVVSKTTAHTFSLDQARRSTKFDAQGDPVEIAYNSHGLVLNGRSVAGEIVKQQDGNYLLESADVTGQARVSLNTATEVEFFRARGKTLQAPVSTRSLLASESLSLRSKDGIQTLTMPRSFVLTAYRQARTPSTQAPVPFEEETHVDGVSGALDLSLVQPEGTYEIQRGAIEGPVHFHMVRTEHRPGQPKPAVNAYDLTSDKLVFDFTQPEGTITAIGHVHWQQTGEMNISGDDDRDVLTTDRNHQVQSIKGTGSPTKTLYIPPSKGGRL